MDSLILIVCPLTEWTQLSAISYQLSAISYQLSAISYQLSAISYQLSAISYQLSAAIYRQKRLIDHAVELGRELTANIIVNCNESLPGLPPNISCIMDEIVGQGPAGGIYTVLKKSETPWVAMFSCDMPLLTTDIYTALYRRRREGQAVVASSHRGVEPLVSLWHRPMYHKLEALLSDGERALHKILTALGAEAVDMQSVLPDYQPSLFTNINLQDDLKALSS